MLRSQLIDRTQQDFEDFGAGLYARASETRSPMPRNSPRSAAGTPPPSPTCTRARPCWTWDPAAESTCCSRPAGSGETGKAYGLDMTDEMLELARRNQREAGVENVEFVKGTIEDVPLPDDSVDVIISNCVINLSGDKPAVFREAARVLKPGGRFAVSDVVADPDMDEETRQDMEQWTGCIAGALTREDSSASCERRGSRASRSRRPTACTSTPARRSSALRSRA